MHARRLDPDRRAQERAESRRRDEKALRSGQVTRDELQRVNGGRRLFRSSILVRRGTINRTRALDAPVNES